MMEKADKKESNSREELYLSARREWNERYGDYIKSAHNWRLIAVGSIGVALICSGGMVALSLQQKIVPYAVEFNEHHEPVRVIRTDAMEHPSAHQIRAGLRTWIVGARSVYLDRRAMRDMLVSTYAMTKPGSSAYGSLTGYHKEHDPYKLSQEHTVEVAVNAVMPVSGDTWRIEWTETKRQLSGRMVESNTWQATATIAIIPPADESQIMLNPIGMYVSSFDWSKRI